MSNVFQESEGHGRENFFLSNAIVGTVKQLIDFLVGDARVLPKSQFDPKIMIICFIFGKALVNACYLPPFCEKT